MEVDRSYVADNTTQRERLRSLVGRLTDAELARPLDAGWTVASTLTHLAFWDQRIVVLVDQWRAAGLDAPPPLLDGDSVHWINDAAKPLLLALAPRCAAELTVAIAEAADRALGALPDEFVAKNAAVGTPLNLNRAHHRREHLDQIERALTRPA